MTSLALFFTRGMSLRAWAANGSLERECALYLRLRPNVERLAFVTYGGRDELEYSSQLPGIEILCNRYALPVPAYERLLPVLHGRTLRAMTVFKTNQIPAAGAAIRAQRLYGKALLARCGYMWSLNAEQEAGADSPLARTARTVERRLFARADRIAVTTSEMRAFVHDAYGVPESEIAITPNAVDTELFAPLGYSRRERTLLFVGRLEAEKNLAALFVSLEGLGVTLTLVGRGSLEHDLRRLAERIGLDAIFLGTVANHDLPELFAAAAAYVLPSLYEGHPKALLEAMACGTPIVATDVRGIRGLIEHERSGLLAGTSAPQLREALTRLLADSALAKRLGAAARERALDFSLDRAVERERMLLDETERARL